MKIVCAPDSLKGVLAAPAAARALADGARRAGADAVELPLADGGEGTAEVLQAAWGGTWRTTKVVDPLGRERTARFLYVEDRSLAVVETAEAIGLPLLTEKERDPLRASSEGLALLIRGALAVGAKELLVTLGGSATVDGGAGLSNALAPDQLAGIRVIALCDVTNPLHGPRGAARAFGPQKGATEAEVLELERRLQEMPHLTPYAALEGAGAAGGLGAAFASLGATLASGAGAVLSAVDFDARVAGSDLVVTGEGRVDATSLEGKVPAAVATACEAVNIPCVVFGGQIDAAGTALYERGATALFALSGQPREAVEDLERLGYGLARLAAGLRRS